jgi:cysteine desulfurase family protein
MEKSIYLNYAATSIRKPKRMIDAVCKYLQEETGLSYNRSLPSSYGADINYQAREEISIFFNVEDASHVVFTENITMSLNMILNGLLEKDDHVIISSLEHNAVMRPLNLIKEKIGIEITTIPSTKEGMIEAEGIEDLIRPNTKLIVLTHASNVLGTILPVKEIFKIAKEHQIITVLDTAQTAGLIPIDMKEYHLDILTFTGHKSLQALVGIGGFAIKEEVATMMKPWLVGGTGSLSHSLAQPETMPEKFESGTLNTVGILSLLESIRWINMTGIEQIANHQLDLTQKFLKRLEGLPYEVLGTKDISKTVPVVSITYEKISPSELSYQLYDGYKIITRSGLHCAPSAHKVAGSFPKGAVRFSFGHSTTSKEIEITLDALREIAR